MRVDRWFIDLEGVIPVKPEGGPTGPLFSSLPPADEVTGIFIFSLRKFLPAIGGRRLLSLQVFTLCFFGSFGAYLSFDPSYDTSLRRFICSLSSMSCSSVISLTISDFFLLCWLGIVNFRASLDLLLCPLALPPGLFSETAPK